MDGLATNIRPATPRELQKRAPADKNHERGLLTVTAFRTLGCSTVKQRVAV